MERHHLWAIAHLLVGRYGDGAKRQAVREADRAARCGDADSQAIWNGVAGALPEEPVRMARHGGSCHSKP